MSELPAVIRGKPREGEGHAPAVFLPTSVSLSGALSQLLTMRLLLFLTTVSIWRIDASFCGDSAIPYSFEVLTDGQPVLGCARPTCFGWDPSGLPASHSASFYKIHRKPDGFFRKERASIPPFETGDIHFYNPQTAECEETYSSTSCDQDTQWVGGIAPLLNVSSAPTALQCCSFEPLKLSVDRGVATVAPGQIVVGGETSKKGRQFAFDYISGVSKTVSDNGAVVYNVNVRRFPCLPLPSRKVFQAPVVEVSNPIPVRNDIEGPFDEEGAVLPSHEATHELLANSQPETVSNEVRAPVQTIQNQPGLPPPMLISGQVPLAQPVFQPAAYVGPTNPLMQNFNYPTAPPTTFLLAPTLAPQCCSPQNYYIPTTPGAYYCFSKDTTVMTIEGEVKTMEELKVGDWVQTIEKEKMVFSRVSMWLHKNSQQEAVFHKITLEDGKILKLTGKHYIFKTMCSSNPEVPIGDDYKAVFAETVTAGDCLYVLFEEKRMKKTKVLQVDKITETGIYAPLVSQGRLMVNGILASCHSVVQSNTLQQTFFLYVDHFLTVTQWLFGGVVEDIRELPLGMDVITSLMEQVLPKNLVTL